MSSTRHCVPSTTAAGRDGAGVSLSGKTGISSVVSSEEDGEDGVSTRGQCSEDTDGDGDGDEEDDEDDEDEDDDVDEGNSTCGQCNDRDEEDDDSERPSG